MDKMWTVYKLENSTGFAALLNDEPMGCKDAVLPESLLRNGIINCLRYEENTRQPYNANLGLFRALAFHLHGIQKLEETSKNFNLIIKKMDGLSANKIQGVHMNDTTIVENLQTLNILLYDIDIVDGNNIGELARSLQKYENTVRPLRYNNQICYMSNIDATFQFFRRPNCNFFELNIQFGAKFNYRQ